ncbi:MAG: CpsD/CapB family tyrosine-protein kinase, partial [Chthoniobacteraceae bacterium]
SAITEAFRTLRTALLFTGSAGGYRSVLFTSAIPGEGKSFCASNYAVALALQGHTTLLIDADLRLPSIGLAFLGNERTPGLGDLLSGHSDLASATYPTDIKNLSVLPAGTRVSLPAELIGGADLPALIASALTRFDRVVIDTAPVHAVSETLLLTPHANAVCLVVQAAKTPAGAVKRALQKMRESGANVVGFILNGVPPRSGGFYYHYHAPGYGKDEVYGASADRPRINKRA